MLRLLAATIGIVMSTFAGAVTLGDEPESIPECAKARPIATEEDRLQATLRIEVDHEGFEVDMVLCILDDRGRKVSEMAGSASGNARIILETDLPLGEYTTIVEADANGIIPGGSFALSQEVNLRMCPIGTSVSRAETHYTLLGSGIEGGGVDCVHEVSSASSSQHASRPKTVGSTQ